MRRLLACLGIVATGAALIVLGLREHSNALQDIGIAAGVIGLIASGHAL